MDKLYKYMSIETLKCVLKNHTIRLNPLNKMDDLQEEKSKDCLSYGKCVFSSSWSAGDREMIPMWKMYADDFQGVRIGLPVEPFVKYHYSAEEVKGYLSNPSETDIDTYIPIEDMLGEDYMFFPAPNGFLQKIDYVDDVEQLEPQLWKTVNDNNGKTPKELWNFGLLGTCKNRYWEFQNEYRYIMYMLPVGFKEFNANVVIMQMTGDASSMYNLLRNATKKEQSQILSYYDLRITDIALSNLEIVFGVKTPLEEKEKIRALVSEINPNIQIKESALSGLYRIDNMN